MHTPVLLQEVIDGLQVQRGGRYIDATVGEGGHTKAMLALGAEVLCLDRDGAQIERLKAVGMDGCVFEQANFSELKEVAARHGFTGVDGVLFDLGISWHQLSSSGKGLSYKAREEELDMRLDPDCPATAAEILNTYTVERLYEMFARNSEEVRSRDIAEEIAGTGKKRRIERVGDLCRIIDRVVGEPSDRVYGRIFQALRIEVNAEFANLEKGLRGAVEVVRQGGRVAVITFHSVEDRMVKKFIREGGYHQVTRKAVQGDRSLSFERSAKLRVFSI